MAELTYLGTLLGMPNVLDPMFPLAYTAFFGMDNQGRPLGLDPLSIQSPNVSRTITNHGVHCMCVIDILPFFM